MDLVQPAQTGNVDDYEPLTTQRGERPSVLLARGTKVSVGHADGTAADDTLDAEVLALAGVVEDNNGRGE